MHVLSSPFELKKLSDEGTFEGLASVYGVKDLGGDVVLPGAFKQVVKTTDGYVRILDGHNTRAPIGKGIVTDTSSGLTVKGRLNLSVARAREVLALMKDRIIEGLSIGYEPLPGGFEFRDGTRYLSALKLWEISTTIFPMNEAALISQVKDATAAVDLRELEALIHAGALLKLSSRPAKAAARALWPILSSRDAQPDAEDLADLFKRISTGA